MLKREMDKQLGKVCMGSELSIYNAAAVKSELLALSDFAGLLEVNLSGVTEIDTAGIQLLMSLKKSRQMAGGGLQLTAHSSAVLDLFELLGLAAYFNDPVVMTKARGDEDES